MKALVAYYSRSGTTKEVGMVISKLLKCDSEEIIDTKNREGPIGYLSAGKDASTKKLTTLKPSKKDPADYDIVIVGTPIWAWTTTPAVRTYLTENKDKIKKVAFFATQNGSGAEKAFAAQEKILGKMPVATLVLTTKEVKQKVFEEKVKKFVEKIRK